MKGLRQAVIVAAVAAALTAQGVHAAPQDKAQADFAKTLKAARAGDVQAQQQVASAYVWGSAHLRRDKVKAMAWLQKAADQGNASAAADLRTLEATQAKYQKLKAAAETGDRDAEYAFADMIRDDDIGMEDGHGFEAPDASTGAITWFRRAAVQGQADAQAYLGLYYLRAYAYAVDPRHSFNWKQAQARPGTSKAGADNFATGLMWYTKAADQGQAEALHAMAVLYALNTPLRDLSKSEAWLQKAAYAPSVGHGEVGGAGAEALQTLWIMYRGLGFHGEIAPYTPALAVEYDTPRDDGKLLVCLRHLRDYGAESNQQVELGEMYRLGLGTPVDEAAATAVFLGVFQDEFRHPADERNAKAALGLMRLGHDDAAGAYFWLSQAYEDTGSEPDEFAADEQTDAPSKFVQVRAAMGGILARLTAAQRARQDTAVRMWQAALPPAYVPPIVY